MHNHRLPKVRQLGTFGLALIAAANAQRNTEMGREILSVVAGKARPSLRAQGRKSFSGYGKRGR